MEFAFVTNKISSDAFQNWTLTEESLLNGMSAMIKEWVLQRAESVLVSDGSWRKVSPSVDGKAGGQAVSRATVSPRSANSAAICRETVEQPVLGAGDVTEMIRACELWALVSSRVASFFRSSRNRSGLYLL